jgi:hypothetical protein
MLYAVLPATVDAFTMAGPMVNAKAEPRRLASDDKRSHMCMCVGVRNHQEKEKKRVYLRAA